MSNKENAKKLIAKDDFIQAANLKRYHLGAFAPLLMKVLHLDKVNDLYERIHNLDPDHFIDALLDASEVKFEINEDDLKKIPKEGPFITVSNHPFGGIDGILLLKIIRQVRPDFKVMANSILTKLEPIQHMLLPVNPFDNKISEESSYNGLKHTMKHLSSGLPVGIFPAGEVSLYQTHNKAIMDRVWMESAVKLIQKANVPVIPVFFQGTNSKIFQILGIINPTLKTARLATEFFNKKKSIVKVRIGHPIKPKDMEEFQSTSLLGKYLRTRTYALGSPLEVSTFFKLKGISRLKKPREIADAIPKNLLLQDLEAIKNKRLLMKQSEYDIYIAPSWELPNILLEIGRVREITFRAVGEGTNKSLDLDEYDLYYHHLFLWDRDNNEIAGAYRMGKGNDIMAQYGTKGFYIKSLFKFKKPLEPYLSQSIELGRSFVSLDYQQKRLPLFLLWKGILYFTMNNPEYRYLIGPVSISNDISQFSKELIISFIRKHHFNNELAKFIKPKKKFLPKTRTADSDIILEKSKDNIQVLDKIIEDIEPDHMRIPVLLKKYIKQNAKIIGFNIDPKFNNSLDGLILLDMHDVPQETLDNLKKEFNVVQEN